MKMTLLFLVLSTFQLVHGNGLFIETSNGDMAPSYRRYYDGPVPDYAAKAKLAQCLIDLRSRAKLEVLGHFLTFATSAQAQPFTQMLRAYVGRLEIKGDSQQQREIPRIQTILKWLVTINNSPNPIETNATFINFFNPDTVGTSCYTAVSDYAAIEQLPNYIQLIRAAK